MFLLSCVLFYFSSWLTFGKSDLKVKVGVDTTLLPVTFYTTGQLFLTSPMYNISYVKVAQCSEATANLSTILITIIQPNNVDFDPTQPFAIVEVASCAAISECIIATNYIDNTNNGGTLVGYDNITIPYNSSQDLYFRLASANSDIPVALHVTYVDDSYPLFYGRFDPTAFGSDAIGSDFSGLGQLITHDQLDTVQTFGTNMYFVNFCAADITTPTYKVTITVTSTPDTPLAAFDLAGCPAAVVDENQCQVTNQLDGVIASEMASSSVSVEIQSAQFSLSQGIFIAVYGTGGELDGDNEYVLGIFLTLIN